MISCADSSTATCCPAAIRCSRAMISWPLRMSRLARGSSSSSSRGWLIRACAISTRCCSPPDSSPTRASANRVASTASSISATASRRVREGTGIPNRCPSIPSATRSRARIGMSGSSRTFCGTYPIGRSRADRGRPPTVTVPAEGRCKPRITRSNVVFPAPFGPIRPVNCPAPAVQLTSSRICRPDSDTLTPATPRISCPAAAGTSARPWPVITASGSRSCRRPLSAGPGPQPASRTGSHSPAWASSRRRQPRARPPSGPSGGSRW